MPTRFIIEPASGYSPQVGHLVSTLASVRAFTLDEIDGLDTDALDHRLDERANSIGVLLEHIAAVEVHYQVKTFGWTLEDEAQERYQLGLRITDASHEAFRGQRIEAYIERLDTVRERTLSGLERRGDGWLYERSAFRDGEANNYFWWFHVIEEEISHRGQLRMLKKRV